jgi:hypothetical protein
MLRRRIHLFELNDDPRAPAALRETIVEALSHTLEWGRMLEGLVPAFEEFLRLSGSDEVLDLCAGAGGPARVLCRAMRRAGRTPPRFVLTDLAPHVEEWTKLAREEPRISFEASPVDATAIPVSLSGTRARTVINALHHFSPELAERILADAVASRAPILVAEGFERNPLRFLSFGLAGLPALLAVPLLSPRRRLQKALLTWATPIALAASIWDGIVSTLRIHTEDDLRAMTARLGGGYAWTYGTYDYFPGGRGTYFYGVPG